MIRWGLWDSAQGIFAMTSTSSVWSSFILFSVEKMTSRAEKEGAEFDSTHSPSNAVDTLNRISHLY